METTLFGIPITEHSCPGTTWVAYEVERPATIAPGTRSSLLGLLSPIEVERCASIRNEGRAASFIVGRGLARLALAHALGLAPRSIEIETGPGGKPRLPDKVGRQIRFNISHSSSRVMVAITAGLAIGVDIEAARRVDERIIPRVLSISEWKRIRDLPRPARDRAFWSMWTVKEACLKALGEPSAGHWRRVMVAPGETGRWRSVRWSRMQDDDYVAAVAVAAG